LEPALAPCRFQHQAHDHVLKDQERRRNAFAAVCSYILDNPVRAKLVTSAGAWPYHGALVPGYPALRPSETDFWKRFWKLYHAAKHPGAGNIVRQR